MNFLKLEPLTADLLPAVIELDHRCLGGLWSLDGYRREIESPNSDLLVLKKAPQPSTSGGLPSHQNFFATEDRLSNREDTSSSQSLSRPGDLEGNSDSFTPSPQPSLIGLGCLWAIAEEAHITVLAIDPDYRQQGLGQAILYALLVSAHQRGLEWATLEVRAGNAAAIRLYEKFGFREVGRRKGYYSDGEDALILWRSGLQKPEFQLWSQEYDQLVRDQLRQSGYEIVLNSMPETAFT